MPISEQNRRWRYRYFGISPVIGNEDAALIARAHALEQARKSEDGELAALIREQQTDDRFSHRTRTPWLVSLDALDDYGRSRYETTAA